MEVCPTCICRISETTPKSHRVALVCYEYCRKKKQEKGKNGHSEEHKCGIRHYSQLKG